MIKAMFGPYSFINISCGREEYDDARNGPRNMVEVAVGMKIIGKLYKAWNGSKQKHTISILTPYASQVYAFEEKLGQKYANANGFIVRVKSVDGLQGGEIEEEDVVILSTVKSGNGGSIDFISILDRWTNAPPRPSLWILGNEKTLTSCSEWDSLIHSAKERKCFFNAEEDKDLAELLAEIKKELHEFDGLLTSDCKLFEKAIWKVMFSDDFRKSFVKLKSLLTKKLVTNLLMRLSCGWRPKRRNVDITCARSKHILKQFKVKDLYVVCSMDIEKQSAYYVQVLKVWDVLPLMNVPELVERLDGIFTTYHDDYLNCCKMKCLKGDLEVPMSWDTSSNIVRLKNEANVDAFDGRSYLEKSGVNESLTLMKFYSLSSGTARHLLSGCDGKELSFPFELTDEEREITMSSRSSFILGRSGTGKTTVLIMKLLQREQLLHLASEGFHETSNISSMNVNVRNEDKESDEETEEAILRQLFVTVSPKLCYAVKQNISRLQRFSCHWYPTNESSDVDMEDIDEATQFRDIPDSFVNLQPSLYPLIITFHKLVMMLDATIGRSYFEKFPEVRKVSQGDENRSSKSVAFQSFLRVKEVNYQKFHSSYWPSFNQQLTKKFDSSVVFTEIISRIKGHVVGEKRNFCRPLELEEYVVISKGQVSSLNQTEKERVFEIFLQYEKRKMEMGEFDLADLVMDLHRRFHDDEYDGHKIDFVYVDEVQDLNMRQIALLKYVCRNFDDGYVFSGDTAQTIAKGVDFRFQDIRSLFYQHFTSESNMKREKGHIADTFHLKQNFRTHCGVLKLSQSVLNLIYRFFPSSIDVLSPETSLVDGNAPVLLQPVNDEDSLESIFRTWSGPGRNMVGFGAEQVILVRDEHEKIQILNNVGKKALVLTIFECKGLEFQDVLLYNFFTSSPLGNQWRVVYEYMESKSLLNTTSMSFPRLKGGKDIVLCSELKQLYVAITRTRQRLWIYEDKEDLTRPMFDYWIKLCLVQVKPVGHLLLQEIQVPSTEEEWRSRGIKLFHHYNYEMAQMCFEKAGDTYRGKWAEAVALRSKANRTSDSDPYESRTYRKVAAQLFCSIGKYELAAQCYIELNEYETAGKIYLEKFGESRLEEAGECFVHGRCYESAARAYAKGKLYSKCLSACFDGKLLETGLEYIQNWRQSSYSGCYLRKRRDELEKPAQDFLENAARCFHSLEEYKTMMRFVNAFDSKKSVRTLLMRLNRLDELLMLEQQWGCFEEAVGIAKLKGDLELEVHLLEKMEKFEDASVLILNHVLCISLFKPNLSTGDLLTKAKTLANNVSWNFYQLVDMEAKVLSVPCDSLFEMKQRLFHCQRLRSVKGEILCARKIIDAHFDLNISEYKWDEREAFDLRKHISARHPKNQLTVQTLIYFWDLWKKEITKVLECLEDLKDEQDAYVEFCLGYFGVRKLGKERLIVKYADAHWARVIGKGIFKKKGNLDTIDEHSFIRAAQSYWSLELHSVGMKVIEVLVALTENVPFSSHYRKSKTLAHCFGVTGFVMDSMLLTMTSDNISVLKRFTYMCVNTIFDDTFLIACGTSMARDVISVRESKHFKGLLEKVITRNINLSKLTYGKIGLVVTILLGHPYLTGNVYASIAASFTSFPPWKEWLQTFISGSDDLPMEVSLISKFHKALEESYNGDWRTGFMSPTHFMYLLERLLVMVSYSYFDDYFFTTRAPFVEWLISKKWNPRSFSLEADHARFLDDAIDFLTLVVEQIVCHEKDTREWVEEFTTNVEYEHRQLVSRLFVMLCVLCASTERKEHCDLVFYLLSRDEVATKLPREMHRALRRFDGNCVGAIVRILAEVCKKIGNPLVMVNARRNWSSFALPGAIFIDLEEKPSRGFMLNKLFPLC